MLNILSFLHSVLIYAYLFVDCKANQCSLFQFGLPSSEIGRRTMWVSVWHSDMFGRNDFLGEVRNLHLPNYQGNKDLKLNIQRKKIISW